MPKPLHIVILAAGQGKRMQSDLPKVLQQVAGRPMLQHVLELAARTEPECIHVVIGHKSHLVKQQFSDYDVNWVDQQQQLGTGHAVMQACPDIEANARILVLLGDTPLLELDSLKRLIDASQEGPAILTANLQDPGGYGRIVRDENDSLTQIVEDRDADDQQLAIQEVNSGMMAGPVSVISECLTHVAEHHDRAEIYLTDVIEVARSRGMPVSAVRCRVADEILGANDRLQLSVLERLYQQRTADVLCEKGVTIADRARIDIRGDMDVGEGVHIDINTVFEGKNTLGDGCRIGPGCVLTDCVLGPETRVQAYSVLEGVVTDGDCDIGPFARLRPGTRLSRQTRVGNFVEIKKASLGVGSKANHLSYLGDARIGDGVNIGAGTITCNYDGVNKYQTEIGDGAFIGSDSQLVAPVSIGRNAVIGAGSTITKDTPDDALTLSRSRQKTVPGWQKPVKSSG